MIGVVGPYNSGCAHEQIPIAARAPGGPLAMLSPTNSDVALTRPGFGSPEGGLGALYPSGRRHYARVHPTEADQGAANAMLARRLGASRVFALSDGGYGESIGFYFEQAARRLGLTVAGFRRWNPRARGYRSLAARVARSGAQAVFVGGVLDANGGEVIKALRTGAPGVHILASDGFLPVSALFRAAGRAAHGVWLSAAGVEVERLGPAGRTFAQELAATQPGGVVHKSAIYAAAATGVMLDAIAASDGTRAGVTRALLGRRPARGILGALRFDRNGDVAPAPITIVRARRGGGSDSVESVEGATIEHVLRPAASLTR